MGHTAQLEEGMPPTPQIHGSNPVNCHLFKCVEKTKIKKKMPGWPNLEKLSRSRCVGGDREGANEANLVNILKQI